MEDIVKQLEERINDNRLLELALQEIRSVRLINEGLREHRDSLEKELNICNDILKEAGL